MLELHLESHSQIRFGTSICIIDDDPVMIFGVKKTLSYLPIASKIKSFENAIEAFNQLKPMIELNDPELPDIIFLDINMPIMDGWQFIELYSALIEQHPTKEIKLYLLSSSIDLNDHKKAKALSAVNGFIMKPIKKEDLMHCLAGH